MDVMVQKERKEMMVWEVLKGHQAHQVLQVRISKDSKEEKLKKFYSINNRTIWRSSRSKRWNGSSLCCRRWIWSKRWTWRTRTSWTTSNRSTKLLKSLLNFWWPVRAHLEKMELLDAALMKMKSETFAITSCVINLKNLLQTCKDHQVTH